MRQRGARKIAALLVVVFVCLDPAAMQDARAEGPSDPAELESFLDGFVAAEMDRYHVPGLVFVMVKNGRTLLRKGYGVADLETGRPVDPEKTLFRVASVSKLFTTTAALQLAEAGKLDLGEDVNAYLQDFKLPATFQQPVTMTHLLTHTAGFDERVFGMAARTREEVRPLGEYLADRMPDRVLQPGDVYSYSNHGLGLAGLLVEQVSGMSFGRYVQQNIFEPLRMRRTHFFLPEERRPDLAVGYNYRDGAPHAVPYDYLWNLAPAGSVTSTGADMARFMVAHLQNGTLNNVRILSEETAKLMHRQQFTHHPKLAGTAYGFREEFVNGRRLIAHGGSWRGFASRLVLDKEADLGFFVSYNILSSDGIETGLHLMLLEALYDRYFPVAAPPVPDPPSDFGARASRFVGSYRYNRHMRDSFGKLGAFVGEIRVSAESDGSLIVDPPMSFLEPVRIVEVDPLFFMRDDGRGYVAFREAGDGRITHLFMQALGPGAFDKLPLIESAHLHVRLIAVIILLFASGIIGWPVAYLLRRPPAKHPSAARLARWIAALSGLLTLFAFGTIVRELSGEIFELAYGVPDRFVWLLRISYLTTALTLLMVVYAVRAWGRGWWSGAARVHYTLITIGAVVLVPLQWYWRLFGTGP
jgi:CubicO group peptidase (beta-lactamase class C family)